MTFINRVFGPFFAHNFRCRFVLAARKLIGLIQRSTDQWLGCRWFGGWFWLARKPRRPV